jgi:type II secretory pathway pseudopilin PulG
MNLKCKGFILIEVLVVLGIFLLVLAGVMSFYISQQRLYSSGSQQVDLHTGLRLAAERISRELRFARDLKLYSDTNWDPEEADTENYSYIFYDPATRRIMLLNKDGSYPLSDPVVNGITFSSDKSTLLFSIEGGKGGASFVLDSSVRPLNLQTSILVPDSPVALGFSFKAASEEAPEPDPDPEPEPDPDPIIIKEMWVINPGSFPTVQGKNGHYSDTRTWYRYFTHTVTEVNLLLSREIIGKSQKSFSGYWRLTINYEGKVQVLLSEDITIPIGINQFAKTISGLSIPAGEQVTIKLEVSYSSGHNQNTVQLRLEDIQLEVVMIQEP